MIQFNQNKMYSMSKGYYLNHKTSVDGIPYDDKNWWVYYVTKNLDSILDVSLSDAELVFDVATPHVPSAMPFVTDYVEYKRYETVVTLSVEVSAISNKASQTYEIDSDIYNLAYMPNSIYLWIAPNTSLMYGSGERCMLSNSYAQITGLEVDYGNLSKLMHHYDEKDLFLMALRNGLEDRTYADWTRTKKVFIIHKKHMALMQISSMTQATMSSLVLALSSVLFLVSTSYQEGKPPLSVGCVFRMRPLDSM